MADDDASIDRAVDEATSTALRKLGDASRDVGAARRAFDVGVGIASWGSLDHKLSRRDGYRRRYGALVEALTEVDRAIAAAQDECRALHRIADR